MSDDAIWLCFVSQIVVVGSSAPTQSLDETGDWKHLSLRRLRRLRASQQKRVVHSVFRRHGVRYAGKTVATCRKSKAVVANLATVLDAGGPKRYITALVENNEEKSVCRQIAKDFAYIKLKGSRDLAAELGLVRDSIALDVRLLKILALCGVNAPQGIKSNRASYEDVHDVLLDRVCRPARVTGAEFDRILYQNYKAICRDLENGRRG